MSRPAFMHAAGPVVAREANFGFRDTGPFDALLMFGGIGPERLPEPIRGALAGYIARGDRVLLLTHTESQQAWVRAQVAILTAVGGRG